MDPKKIVVLSLGMRGIIVLCVLILIGGHHIFSEVWFNPMPTAAQLAYDLRYRKLAIDSFDEFGQTRLMKAIAQGQLKIAQLLLLYGADPNLVSQDTEKKTALHYAVYASDAHDLEALDGNTYNADFVVETLLRYGADPNIRDAFFNPEVPQTREESALHMTRDIADFDKRLRILQLLITYGGNVNVQNGYGYTLLHMGVERNDGIGIDLLKDNFGSLLNYGIKACVVKVSETPQVCNYFTPLELANFLYFSFLIDNHLSEFPPLLGAKDVAERGPLARTGLMFAIMRNDYEFAKAQIARRADINAHDTFGNTPLHYALFIKSQAGCIGQEGLVIAFLKLLLDNKVLVTTANNNGDTPLHLAVLLRDPNERCAAVSSLIKAGADLKAKNQIEDSPLHSAIRKNYINVIAMLNDPNITPNKDGLSPQQLAELVNHLDALAALKNPTAGAGCVIKSDGQQQKCDKQISGVVAAPQIPRTDEVPQSPLIDSKLNAAPPALGSDNPKQTDSSNRTGLMLAIMRDDYDFAYTQVERDSLVNAFDDFGNRPLHYAVLNQVRPLAYLTLLLENNAIVNNISNNENDTPLHLAVLNIKSDKDRREAVLLLLKYGADIKAQNKNGDSPLHLAIRENYIDLIKILNGPNIGNNKEGLSPAQLAEKLGRLDALAALSS